MTVQKDERLQDLRKRLEDGDFTKMSKDKVIDELAYAVGIIDVMDRELHYRFTDDVIEEVESTAVAEASSDF